MPRQFAEQTWLLLWKNALVKGRSWMSSVSEILLPVAFVVLILWLQSLDPDVEQREMVYTCPKRSGFTPSLIMPQKKGVHLWLEVSTVGLGPGIKTVPPLLYLLLLASKTKSQIALVDDGAGLEWLDRFVSHTDELTRDLKSSEWQAVSSILESVMECSLCSFRDVAKVYNSTTELWSYITSESYAKDSWTSGCPGRLEKPRLHMALLMHKADEKMVDYTIQTNVSIIPLTYPNIGNTNRMSIEVDEEWNDKYLMSGFSTLQLQVDRYVLNESVTVDAQLEELAVQQLCDSVDPLLQQFLNISFDSCRALMQVLVHLGVSTRPLTAPASFLPNNIRVAEFPTAQYTQRDFYKKIKDVFALCLVLTFLWPVSRLIRGIVHEKETKLREGMRMMGLQEAPLYLAWLFTYGVIFFLVALIISVISHTHLFNNSSFLLVFSYFFLFGLDVIAYCFVVSVVFNKARTASIAGVVLFFMGFFAYFAVNDDNATASSKAVSSLLAPTAFGIGASLLASFEEAGEGVRWSNLNSVARESDISFGAVLCFMLFDLFVYLFMAYYLNKVVPQEFGVAKRWDFLCRAPSDEEDSLCVVDVDDDDVVYEEAGLELDELERSGRCLKIVGLRKEFPVGDGSVKVAVDGLNLTLYEGEIFCLLGHNGAGKTTTISMLTGLIPPTSGTASVYGQPLGSKMTDIRKSLGVCPQQNVLFSSLTVEEHLLFYARLKCASNIRESVERHLRDIDLLSKRHVVSSSLSGGQKRKLSLAIALIGDSKVVFLDEPTSGCDVWARRHIWRLLRNSRAGRIIVLTTHFMDEADVLGDRIGIMAQGRLKCCGSSLFLKSAFGVGYTVTVLLKSNHVDKDQVLERVRSHLGSFETLSTSGAQLVFRIPLQASSRFGKLFLSLDKDKDSLGVDSYGVSVTTLEEVFIKIADNEDTKALSPSPPPTLSLPETNIISDSGGQDLLQPLLEKKEISLNDRQIFMIQVKALYKKRFRYAKRDRKAICCNTLLPVLLLFMGLALLKAFPLQDPPSLALDVDMFEQDSNYIPVNSSEATNLLTYIPDSIAADIPLGLNNSCPEQLKDNIPHGSELRGLSQWLLDHAHENKTSIYGAIHLDSVSPFEATILTNSTAFHGAGVFQNALSQALFKSSKGGTLIARNQPFQFTSNFKKIASSFTAVSASIIIMIAFSFVPASIATFVVKEREIAAKHQQQISGASIGAYWSSMFLWDITMYLVPWSLSMALVWSFGISSFQGENLVPVALLFFSYGLAICPFTYCISFLFSSHSTAQNAILLFNFLTGLVLMIASFVMRVLKSTHDINKVMLYLYRIFPGFCLGNGLLNLTVQSSVKSLGFFETPSPYSLNVIGMDLIYLFSTSVVYFTMAVFIDVMLSYPQVRQRLCQRTPVVVDDEEIELDEDVRKEQQRVEQDGYLNDSVVVKRLHKVYPDGTRAVNNLSFGVSKGECFGFLGVNGAGKTSTMKMITGDLLPSKGSAYLEGMDIMTEQSKIRRLIGYCPQFDALLEHLTCREHLELYGSLKCVPEEELSKLVGRKLKEMNLVEFENKAAGTLSGGNKRKLSVAIAMIGDPKIVFLDEPSSGMDIVNRRFMWQVIARDILVKKKATLILTSHSMEECEALCSKIAIMVGGQLKCFGALQHLKNRFGKGLTLDVKLVMPSAVSVSFAVDRLQHKRSVSTVEVKTHWDNVQDNLILSESLLSTFACEVMDVRGVLSGQVSPGSVLISIDGKSLSEMSYKDVLGELKKGALTGGEVSLKFSTAENDGSLVLYPEDVESACEALGDKSKYDLLSESDRSGWIIASALRKDGSIPARTFCSWWLTELALAKVKTFLQAFISETAECVELGSSSSKWRLGGEEGLSLGKVFELLEEHKERLRMKEYAVSQTTLEQIFLSIASQQ